VTGSDRQVTRRVLLEKLIVAKLVKKMAFSIKPEFVAALF
jgi:hypothetical protein